MKKLVLLFLFLTISAFVSAQTSLTGIWEGAITIQDQELGIILHIEGEQGNYSGTLDIPAQGASNLPLMYVVVQDDSVSTAFNTGSSIGEFKGQFTGLNRIEGTYTQAGSSFPFRVERQESTGVEVINAGAGEELIISNQNVEIAGTLVLPENISQPQLVIFLSGSGAQNRDSEIVGFRPFADIAEYLKSQGIASFRFDDRQIGQSTGDFSNASLSTLASDVNAIIQFLQDSVNTQFGDITLLGHSQGGILAGEVASSNFQVDKLILMASPVVSMSQILEYQVRHAYEQIELPETVIESEVSAREDLMHAIVDGEGVDQARESYENAYRSVLNSLSEEQLQAVPDDREGFIGKQASLLVSFYSTPQMKSLLFYDPLEDLSGLSIPVLVLFGGKDTQVSDELNEPAVQKVLSEAGMEFDINVIENANHLFQEARTGDVTEYASLEKEFIDGFLPLISQWIQAH
jgi:pimeloyl-ACP methyl ester carboxylesterase